MHVHAHPMTRLGFLTMAFIGILILGRPTQVVEAQSMYMPTIVSYHISNSAYGSSVTPLNLTAGTTTRYYITGTIQDDDGWSDVLGVSANLYRSGVNSWCGQDLNSCYYPSCNRTGSGNMLSFSCPVDIEYFADATDGTGGYPSDNWRVMIGAWDSWYYVTKDDYSTEVSSLLALQTSGTINFGNLALGQSSTTSATLNVYNSGNVHAQLQMYTNGMDCDSGSLEAARQRFATWDTDYIYMPWVMTTYPSSTGLVSAQRTDDFNDFATTLYFRISVPSEGVGGNCSGVNYINPVAL